MKKNHGFTLIELMVVVVIIAIFTAIALPSYQQYMRKRDLAVAQQESLRIAAELERFKSKNFSYKGFDPTFSYPAFDKAKGELYLPVGATSSNAKFLLTVVDTTTKKPLNIIVSGNKETDDSKAVKGLGWVMKVERTRTGAGNDSLPKEPKNYDLLLNSNGLRCMTRTANIVTNYLGCGTSDMEKW